MRKLMIIALGALALAGCGAAPQSGAAPSVVPTVVAASSVATVTPVPLPTTAPAPTGAPDTQTLATPRPATAVPASQQQPAPAAGPSEAQISAARQALAAQLGLAADQLKLSNAEAKGWPDKGIGCPKRGVMYIQVITPGFLMVFDEGKRSFAVHTDTQDGRMLLCDQGQPVPLESSAAQPAAPQLPANGPALVPTSAPGAGEGLPADAAMLPIVALARQRLAADLGIAPEEITLVRLESVEWPDGSLGCPKPGVMYLQVITPGYRAVFAAQGREYTYHTDTRRQTVRCDAP